MCFIKLNCKLIKSNLELTLLFLYELMRKLEMSYNEKMWPALCKYGSARSEQNGAPTTTDV